MSHALLFVGNKEAILHTSYRGLILKWCCVERKLFKWQIFANFMHLDCNVFRGVFAVAGGFPSGEALVL